MLTQYPRVSTPPLLQVLPGVRRHRGFQWPRHARERHACGHALRHQPGCPAQRWLRGHGTRRQDCFHWCVSSHAGPVGGWLRLDAAAAEHSTWAVGWQAMQGCCISLHTCTRPHQPHMSAHCRPTDLGDSSSDTISTPSDLANSYFPYTNGAGAAIHSGTAAPGAWVAAGRCVCGLAGVLVHAQLLLFTMARLAARFWSADSWGATNIYYDFLARQVRAHHRQAGIAARVAGKSRLLTAAAATVDCNDRPTSHLRPATARWTCSRGRTPTSCPSLRPATTAARPSPAPWPPPPAPTATVRAAGRRMGMGLLLCGQGGPAGIRSMACQTGALSTSNSAAATKLCVTSLCHTGRAGDYTVTSPANAKNCLSVGATQVGGARMATQRPVAAVG